MYFVFGDYFDMSLTGDVYTLGSWAMDLNSRYMVKYKFSATWRSTIRSTRRASEAVLISSRARTSGCGGLIQDAKSRPELLSRPR